LSDPDQINIDSQIVPNGVFFVGREKTKSSVSIIIWRLPLLFPLQKILQNKVLFICIFIIFLPPFPSFIVDKTDRNTDMSQLATFGAGCFWGTQKFFNKQFKDGIVKSAVGYLGGTTKNPSYKDVCTGKTGHAEVLQLQFDANKVNYADLVRFFYRMHDPTTLNRQGNDAGTQYRSAVFYHSPEQKTIAEQVKEEMEKSGKFKSKITTEIAPASEFYVAEDYHQDYLEANPTGYCNHYLRW